MKQKYLAKAASGLLALLCISCISFTPAYAVPQGTEGDELQVVEAQKLEVQLGTNWAGVEFMLKTDAGLYPDVIPVGEDGVLRMEIGGSKAYVLSCLRSDIAAPLPAEKQTPVTFKLEAEQNPEDPKQPAEKTENTVAGIPVKHLVIFIAGIVLAVSALIAMAILKKRRENSSEPDYDDDNDDE